MAELLETERSYVKVSEGDSINSVSLGNLFC